MLVNSFYDNNAPEKAAKKCSIINNWRSEKDSISKPGGQSILIILLKHSQLFRKEHKLSVGLNSIGTIKCFIMGSRNFPTQNLKRHWFL